VALSIEQKQFHDLVGYYNRFDLFRLTVDQRAHCPITVIRDEAGEAAARGGDPAPV
jgi:nitrilase